MLKKKLMAMAGLFLLPCLSLCGEDAKKEVVAEAKPVDMEKVSDSLGHFFVRNLDISTSHINTDKLIQGIKDEVAGKPAPLNDQDFQAAIVQIQVKQFQLKSEKNLKEAEAFLTKNAKEKGIFASNPKLQYKIEKEGQGEEVKAESTPLINYTGKFLDGKVFSSSEANKAPVALALKDTVAGISQGICGMKKGEKRVLYIHPDLAFGVNSPFPPNSLIVFEVEIVEPIAPAPAAETAQATDGAKANKLESGDSGKAPAEMKKEAPKGQAETKPETSKGQPKPEGRCKTEGKK